MTIATMVLLVIGSFIIVKLLTNDNTRKNMEYLDSVEYFQHKCEMIPELFTYYKMLEKYYLSGITEVYLNEKEFNNFLIEYEMSDIRMFQLPETIEIYLPFWKMNVKCKELEEKILKKLKNQIDKAIYDNSDTQFELLTKLHYMGYDIQYRATLDDGSPHDFTTELVKDDRFKCINPFK